MTRDEFMVRARCAAKQILEGKENGIMNLVQRAWAEGKRNAEVETLREAIEEALDRRERPKPSGNLVYPTWREFIENYTGILMIDVIDDPIPADIAQKLGLKPKECV